MKPSEIRLLERQKKIDILKSYVNANFDNYALYLFGSVARNDFRYDSDIDAIVVIDNKLDAEHYKAKINEAKTLNIDLYVLTKVVFDKKMSEPDSYYLKIKQDIIKI